jgi:hypothetical protein
VQRDAAVAHKEQLYLQNRLKDREVAAGQSSGIESFGPQWPAISFRYDPTDHEAAAFAEQLKVPLLRIGPGLGRAEGNVEANEVSLLVEASREHTELAKMLGSALSGESEHATPVSSQTCFWALVASL